MLDRDYSADVKKHISVIILRNLRLSSREKRDVLNFTYSFYDKDINNIRKSAEIRTIYFCPYY